MHMHACMYTSYADVKSKTKYVCTYEFPKYLETCANFMCVCVISCILYVHIYIYIYIHFKKRVYKYIYIYIDVHIPINLRRLSGARAAPSERLGVVGGLGCPASEVMVSGGGWVLLKV